jgi:hypothetical protein
MAKYILLGGQSNARGRGPGGSFAIDPKVRVWNNTDNLDGTTLMGTQFVNPVLGEPPFSSDDCNNLGVHAADMIAQALNQQVRAFNVAKGGLAISNWHNGTEQPMLTRTKAILQLSGITRLDAFMWMQGESDNATPYATYKARFDGMIASLTAAGYITAGTAIVVGECSSWHTGSNLILNQLVADYGAMARIAPIRDFVTLTDNTHFTGQALVSAGHMFAARALEIGV